MIPAAAAPAARRVGGSTAARLAVLAAATFVYVTFEVFPVGLIRDIARDLDVSEGRVGLLISGYAVIAAVVTVPAVALASRVSRGTALAASLVVLIAAEVIAAASTGFAMMAASRVAAALTHGVLWSLVAPAAAAMVPRAQVGSATAAVFGGASLAAIVGSPGTTLVGGLIGWRATALLLAAATAVVTVALVWAVRPGAAAAVPADTARAGAEGDAQEAVDWPAVLRLCGTAVVLVTAHFLSYTYFAVITADAAGGSGPVVALLAVFGVAGAVGTYLIGRHGDRAPQRAAAVTMAAFTAGVALLALAFAPAPPAVRLAAAAVATAVWGGAFAAAGPVFQTGVMRLAAGDADRASSVYVTGFQVGIAGGSALGAALLGGPTALLPAVSAVLAAAVLAVVLLRRPIPSGRPA
ncbi:MULTISPECIES: MFS transporter [Streptomyces]|uniref:MFS transporter n=1 Tax=Streptomyces TaxID=1883 RepID=UPI0019C56F67|nr:MULTISPECIES: MFS transporter [Streptomyces]GGT14694.1 putative MFS-type transporter [Streptomyces toxytricini]